jgi:hypothetical protein
VALQLISRPTGQAISAFIWSRADMTKADPSLKGTIESYSRPVQQDVYLKKEVR